jgi:AcrR family transcriptional regulator
MSNRNPSSRERLLEAAGRLFYHDGFRAVGVDTVAAEAGVGKMTLYRHFPSKDDLIVAYLEDANRRFWQWFDAAAERGGENPCSQLLAVFAGLQALVTAPACLGCPFLNAAVDFPEPGHPGHQVAIGHKQAVLARLTALAEAAGAANPRGLAGQLLVLMDGAFMAVRLFGPNNPAQHVAQAARALVDVHITPERMTAS